MPPQRPRSLRRNATDAEALLWSRLRNRRLAGYKFRRQHPVGPYVADFACPESMLIVELDGGQHGPETDAARAAYLEGQGYTVLRFWNNDALGNTDGVLETILRHLESEP
jgi:very-short-patch-repair endonuclease